jgi:hypothetical protein
MLKSHPTYRQIPIPETQPNTIVKEFYWELSVGNIIFSKQKVGTINNDGADEVGIIFGG